jgi:hypothetical protein
VQQLLTLNHVVIALHFAESNDLALCIQQDCAFLTQDFVPKVFVAECDAQRS